MPADVFYGADCEIRIGIMPDALTDPTSWSTVTMVSATFNKQRDRKERPLMGLSRQNALDPVKPVDGFTSLSGDIVIDADARMVPLWLRHLLGPATSSGPVSGIYTHTFASGTKTPRYCCLQIKVGATDVRIYRGLTLDTTAFQASGEGVQDFDVQLSVVGISVARATDFLTGTSTSAPAASVINRCVFRIDGVAASNTLQANWSYGRSLAKDSFLSTSAVLSGLRPGRTTLTGTAQFRAVGVVFDQMEEDGTEFSPDIQGLGVVASHELRFVHACAKLNAAPIAISGPGVIERTFNWTGYQSGTAAGAKIIVANDQASYL